MDDLLGQAQRDYYHQKATETLWLYTRLNRGMDGHPPNDGDFYYSGKAEVDLGVYFRARDEMPQMELEALALCRGRILEIGAGTGCHALELQKMGKDVTALERSPFSTGLMKKRGVRKTICQDFLALEDVVYDTLLLLWNGVGITGTLAGFRKFLAKATGLLQPGGQILFDSTDLAFIFKERPSSAPPYYGEACFKHEYKNQQSAWFEWLFADRFMLCRVAREEGWEIEVLAENDKSRSLGEFLVRCRRS